MSTKAMFCPHCGKDVTGSNGSFCSQCGANLTALVAEIECANCGQLIQDIDIYCRHCRHFVSMDG